MARRNWNGYHDRVIPQLCVRKLYRSQSLVENVRRLSSDGQRRLVTLISRDSRLYRRSRYQPGGAVTATHAVRIFVCAVLPDSVTRRFFQRFLCANSLFRNITVSHEVRSLSAVSGRLVGCVP